MRKFLVAIMALSTVCVGQTFAKGDGEKKTQLQHEIHAGLAVSHIRGYADTSGKAGFTAGWKAEYELPFVTGLYVNGGIDLTQKGYRANGNRANMFYAVVPIHVGYRYDFNQDWSAFAEFGPYFGAGLGGKERGDISIKTGEETYEYHHKYKMFAGDGYNVKRFDWGMGLRLGAEYKKKYDASIGFDWGCYDLSPSGVGNKNFTFSLTVGYRF